MPKMKFYFTLLPTLLMLFQLSAQKTDTISFMRYDRQIKKEWLGQLKIEKEKWLKEFKIKNHSAKDNINELFESIEDLMKDTSIVTDPNANRYAKALIYKLSISNPNIDTSKIRLLFSRNFIPNAYSCGEGTIIFNAGLLIHLVNEAELLSIIGHEIGHYLLEHSKMQIIEYARLERDKEYLKKVSDARRNRLGANKTLKDYRLSFLFTSRHKNRAQEISSDSFSLKLMQSNTINNQAVMTALLKVDSAEYNTPFADPKIDSIFNFEKVTFNPQWVAKEESIFGEPLNTSKQKNQHIVDSLKTHPEMPVRIERLKMLLDEHSDGELNPIDSNYFKSFKEQMKVEMAEDCFRNENISRHLFYALQLAQTNPENPYGAWSVLRDLNKIYELKKSYKLGLYLEKERKENPDNYNDLIRMIANIKILDLTRLAKQYAENNAIKWGHIEDVQKEIDLARKNCEAEKCENK